MLKVFINTLNKFTMQQIKPNKNLMVVITGCDSGLGLLMAKKAYESGLTVVAGVLQGSESVGARQLREIANPLTPLYIIDLDITKEESVENLKSTVADLLNKHQNTSLHALVNNAGVMVMGDFEWQTKSLTDKQWSVNVCGTWEVTKHLLWALRDAAKRGGCPRIINVNSHCSLQPLRTMTVYSATKAAIKAWSEGLRMELKHCGIHVVEYIPGRVSASNILANQRVYFEEMKSSFDEEQLAHYEKYFDEFSSYINAVGEMPKVKEYQYETQLQNKFLLGLLTEKPNNYYKSQPWRYAFYYTLFRIVPNFIKNSLIDRFLLLPSHSIKR